jgi:hypothetical protein
LRATPQSQAISAASGRGPPLSGRHSDTGTKPRVHHVQAAERDLGEVVSGPELERE